MKICTKCNDQKASSNFSKNGFDLNGNQRFRSACSECEKIRVKKNPNRKLYSKKYRDKNPHYSKLSNRENFLKNRDSFALRGAQRRLIKNKSKPQWANIFFMREAYNLARLRTKITGIKWHVDHIVPLRSKLVCGLHCEDNFQVITAIENIKKKNIYWPDMP